MSRVGLAGVQPPFLFGDHVIGRGNLFKPGEPVAIGFASGTPLAFPETKNNGTNQRVDKHVEIIS